MNKKIQKLMKKSGFVFWDKEPWKPNGAVVDWSCDYDKEMSRFVELLVEDVCERFVFSSDVQDQIMKRYIKK